MMGGVFDSKLLWTLLTIPMGLLTLYYYLYKRKPRLDLRNKVVFITGASSGLGKACAKAFFTAGCKVILSGRREDALQTVKDQLLQNKIDRTSDVAIVVFDLEYLDIIPGKMEEALSIFGCIDILVNNGGMSFRGKTWDASLEIDQKLMNVNFFAQIQVTRAVLPHMMQRKSGHIVAIGSTQGLMGIPSRTAYAASKHAVNGYFDSLRADLSLFNVDVCIINPSYIKTNLSANAVCSDGSKYGEIDKNTSKGMEPSYVASQVVRCVTNRIDYKDICTTYIHIAVFLRKFAPSLFFKFMERQARKEDSAARKNSS